MKDLTQNPDLRKREVVDDYFGDWKWREGLSELMIPIIGNLYRNGIQIYKMLKKNKPMTISSRIHFYINKTIIYSFSCLVC